MVINYLQGKIKQITQNTYGNGGALIWAAMESGYDLVKKFGTAPKKN